MTTFTKSTAAGETPLVEVDPSKRLSKIDPMIYGGFTEHMGRCIYGGIYEPGNPHGLSDAGTGFRTDVLAALQELDIPVVRYPGGNFCATYHWTDGIGPVASRPSRPELAWLGVETNAFGTDEFMSWLDRLRLPGRPRVEPYLCLNMGTGTLDEALAWVEYCNGARDTYWANRRRANGRAEPYGVRYWALGNEVWGPWQVEQATKEAYARKAAQWAKALRLLDPDIRLVLCGETGHSSWDHHVLRECVDWVDLHSVHIYTTAGSPAGGFSHLKNATAPLTAERAIQIAGGLIDLARIERSSSSSSSAASATSTALTSTGAPSTLSRPAPKICFDEWNVWDPQRAPGDQGAEEQYTLSDALAVAVWLNVFVRQSRWLGMANIAQTVNVISPLMTSPRGIVRQATWWPLLLFSRYMRGWTVAAHVRCGAYAGETHPAWLQGVLAESGGGAPWLDVSASVGEDGVASLAVVNIHETDDFEVELKGVVGSDVTVYLVSGEKLDDVNTEGSEKVGLSESKWEGGGSYTFPKHSFTMLRWKA